MKDIRAKRFFTDTDYAEVWTEAIRKRHYSDGYEEQFLMLLAPQEGEKILEIGCGEGRFIPFIRREGSEYVSIDISARMISYAISRADTKTHFVCCDAEFLPFRNRCFDKAFSFATMFFIPNYKQAIKEAARVSDIVLVEVQNAISDTAIKSRIKSQIFYKCPLTIARWSRFARFLLISLQDLFMVRRKCKDS